jgi:hypothetical protein
MKQRTKLIVFGGFMAVWGAFAIPMAWHWMQGIGCVTAFDEWNAAGRRVALEGMSIWGQRDGYCYYWNDEGQLDLERSGYFDSDDRVRPLASEEIERCNRDRFVGADLFAILRAESLFHSRNGRCATDPEIFEDSAWSEATGKHNPRPRDPWGRPYELNLTHAGAGIVVICRGQDGVEGGTGQDADQQREWDVTMGHYGGDAR